MVHTCPRCELRFESEAELTDHLSVDHGADPSSFERLHYKLPAARPAGKRFLAVAASPAADNALAERVIERAQGATAHVHLVVAADPIDGDRTKVDDRSIALASYRLRHLVDRLHDAGIEAAGEATGPDPVRAAEAAVEHERADEVIVGVHAGEPHVLHVDVAKALEHHLGLPVDVVAAHR